MLICTRFPSDNDSALMQLQDGLYPELIGLLFEYPRKRYLDSAGPVLFDAELVRRLLAMDGFDHRTLQGSHDIIAARFRFLCDPDMDRTLFETTHEHEQRLKREWRSFLRQELLSLCNEDVFVRAVLMAAAFPNPDVQGCAAETQLRVILMERYRNTKIDRTSD